MSLLSELLKLFHDIPLIRSDVITDGFNLVDSDVEDPIHKCLEVSTKDKAFGLEFWILHASGVLEEVISTAQILFSYTSGASSFFSWSRSAFLGKEFLEPLLDSFM